MNNVVSFSSLACICSCTDLPSDETLTAYKWSIRMESQADPSKVVNMDSDEFSYTHDDAEVTVKWTVDRKGLEVTPSVKFLKGGWVFTSMIGPLIPIQSDRSAVIAKVFESKDGKRSAVVVWNCSADKPAHCTVSLSGRRLVSSDSPEGPVRGTELQPQSMKVLIFD